MCWQADGQFKRYRCAVEVEAKGGGSKIRQWGGLDPSKGRQRETSTRTLDAFGRILLRGSVRSDRR